MIIGNYEVTAEFVKKRFFVQSKKDPDDNIRITQKAVVFTLVHVTSGTEVIFKRHWHCGQWKWSDSRVSGSQSLEHVISELSRLLYKNDKGRALAFVLNALHGIAPID